MIGVSINVAVRNFQYSGLSKYPKSDKDTEALLVPLFITSHFNCVNQWSTDLVPGKKLYGAWHLFSSNFICADNFDFSLN